MDLDNASYFEIEEASQFAGEPIKIESANIMMGHRESKDSESSNATVLFDENLPNEMEIEEGIDQTGTNDDVNPPEKESKPIDQGE